MKRRPSSKRWTQFFSSSLSHLFLIIVGILALAPFAWLLSSSLKPPTANVYAWPPEFIPWPPYFDHYRDIFSIYPLTRFALNSVGVAIVSVILNILLGAMAGYALARLQFPGRDLIFYAIIGSMTLPFTVILVPLFVTTAKLNLTNSYLGLILPFAVSAFSIFLFRQAFRQIPLDLEDAARLDGASNLRIFGEIMLPLIRPTVATVGIFAFYGSWNNFLWPLVTLRNDALYTLPLGLAEMQGQLYGNWFQIAAASVAMMIPVIVVFFGAQRHFVQGLTAGASKG